MKQLLRAALLGGVVLLPGCAGDTVPGDGDCATQLVSPEDGAVLDNGCSKGGDLTNWEFRWRRCDSAEAYHLRVVREGAQIPLVNDSTLTVTTFVFSDDGFVIDSNRLDWKWGVRTLVGGRWGPWTERTFDVEPLDTDCQGGGAVPHAGGSSP